MRGAAQIAGYQTGGRPLLDDGARGEHNVVHLYNARS